MRTRLALAAAGLAAILYGGWGVVTGGIATARTATAGWLLTGVLLHDLLVFPVVITVGAVLTRLVPAAVRPIVQGGLLVAATVTLVAVPVLSGRGGSPDHPSVNPLDYPRNLTLVLTTIALTTTALALARLIRLRRNAPHPLDTPKSRNPACRTACR